MAKQGQHKRDARDQRVSPGRRNPKQSMTITTGSYKKRETYEEQARQHKDTDPEPQRAEPRWEPDTRPENPLERRSNHKRARRSGSDSNTSRRSRGY